MYRIQSQDILDLLSRFGMRQYCGEPVSQIEHAWQCGYLARKSGASPALQLASCLHDIGHLLVGWDGTPTLEGRDDRHEEIAAHALYPLWGDAVAEPIRLHVQAKRYLVSRQAGYLAKLSQDSVRSLMLQGGPMTTQEMEDFERLPYFKDALQLRVWDDLGKRPDWYPDTHAHVLNDLRELMMVVSDQVTAFSSK